jgi:hypothetical protein
MTQEYSQRSLTARSPTSTVATIASAKNAATSLDHLVGASDQLWWHGQA